MKGSHRGHDLVFDENSEEWTCPSLALSNASLKALKRAVDRASKERRTVNVECWHLRDYAFQNDPELRKVVICLLREGDRKCDVRDASDKRDNKGRSQVDFHELYPLDQKHLLDVYLTRKAAEKAAAEQAEKAHDKLKPLTAKDVREIVARQADEETT